MVLVVVLQLLDMSLVSHEHSDCTFIICSENILALWKCIVLRFSDITPLSMLGQHLLIPCFLSPAEHLAIEGGMLLFLILMISLF